MAFTTKSHGVQRELGITVQSLLLVHQSIILKEKLELNKKKNQHFPKRQTAMHRRPELPTHDKPRRPEFFKQKFAVRKHCFDHMINKSHT